MPLITVLHARLIPISCFAVFLSVLDFWHTYVHSQIYTSSHTQSMRSRSHTHAYARMQTHILSHSYHFFQLDMERQRAEAAARQAQEERELREKEAARSAQLEALSNQTRKHAKVVLIE